jgi:ApaG domain
MLSFGALRFPVQRHLAVRGGGARRAFHCQQGRTLVALDMLAFHGVHHHANNNTSREGHPSTLLPPFTSRRFSTSHIETAGVSDHDGNNRSSKSASENTASDERLKNQQEAAAAHTRLVYRRLYRILFRRINQVENALLQQQHAHAPVDDCSANKNSSPLLLLLQPLLNPHCVGSSRVIDNIADASPQQVLTLFYHWSLYAMTGGLVNDNDDENENESDDKDDDLEQRLTEWLNAVCPNLEEQENSNIPGRQQRHQYPWQENRALDTLWVRIPVLRHAIRQAFSAAVSSPSKSSDLDDTSSGKNRHRQFCIQASIQAYKFISQQLVMIPLTSTSTTAVVSTSTGATTVKDDADGDDDESITTTYDRDRGTFFSTKKTPKITSDDEKEEEELVEEAMINNELIRVTAVSRWIGRSLNPSSQRREANSHDHHFVYRLRIENLTKSYSADTEKTITTASTSSSLGAGSGGVDCRGMIVQLNGRSWEIESLNEGDRAEKHDHEEVSSSEARRDIVKVHAPREGAVGQHPILGPEQAFEYYSRCNLSTPTGTMQGRFYFTIVSSSDDDDDDGDETPQGGNESAAKSRHFKVLVQPFSLRAERL